MKTAVLVSAIATVLTSTFVNATEIRFLHTTAIKPAVDELVPLFEAKTGNKVAASYGPAGAVVQRVRSGEAFPWAIRAAPLLEPSRRFCVMRRWVLRQSIDSMAISFKARPITRPSHRKFSRSSPIHQFLRR